MVLLWVSVALVGLGVLLLSEPVQCWLGLHWRERLARPRGDSEPVVLTGLRGGRVEVNTFPGSGTKYEFRDCFDVEIRINEVRPEGSGDIGSG